MKKIIRLTESKLINIIRNKITEQANNAVDLSVEKTLLKKKEEELSVLKLNYDDIISEWEKLNKEIDNLKRRINPSITLTTSKHHSTKKPFIVGRSMFLKGKNDYVQMSVYVGKLSDFENGIEDVEAKKIAYNKMVKKIKDLVPLDIS